MTGEDGEPMTEALGDLVRDRWSTLLLDGFSITAEEAGRVALASRAVQVVAIHDPRGEVDVSVQPLGHSWPHTWRYSALVGRASVGRLLELALAEMTGESAILDGDPAFYAQLGIDNEDASKAWTEYSAGRGPRPSKKCLP